MRECGKMYQCDRCKDVGFFSVEPATWDYEVGVGDLCPRCKKQWGEVKGRFKSSTKRFW